MFKLSKSQHLNLARIYHQAESLFDNLPIVKKKRRRKKFFKAIRYTSYSIVFICLMVFIVFISYAFTFKQIYSNAMTGKSDLESAAILIKQQQFKEAAKLAVNAQNNFNVCLDQLDETKNNFLVSNFRSIEWHISNVEYLLAAAKLLSKAMQEGANFGQGLKNLTEGDKDLTFSGLNSEEKKRILGYIYESSPELNGLKANLDLAILNLNNVKTTGLLRPLKDKISILESQFKQTNDILTKAIPLSQILPSLAGYPEPATYLVVIHDHRVLRPTGGLVGTFGVLEIANGDITKFNTHDVYDLDMPVKNAINTTPPTPLKEYLGVDKWYLRDANWSPHWPMAARKIEFFYKSEVELLKNLRQKQKVEDLIVASMPENEFNGVIGITPEFITDLLHITGPLVIDDIGYNEDSFVKLLEHKTRGSDVQLGVPVGQNKEIIGDIVKELKIKLFDLPASRWSEIFFTIDDNILQKNILLYLKDPELSNLVRAQGYGGEIKNTRGDYLMVVDANISAPVTDTAVSRSISYRLEQSPNGLFAKLRINYAYGSGLGEEMSAHKTYTRVYAPLGSQLLDSISEGEVITQNELGKTSFSAFISIEPDEIGSLYFEYKLPDNIHNMAMAGQYGLYIQKQPGNEVGELTVDLQFINGVRLYNPTGFYVEKTKNGIKWETDLSMDREFEVGF